MNEDNGRDKSDNNNRVAKVLSAIAIGGIVVAASLLLSGLSVLGSYHSVLAQQNMTQSGGGGGNATTTTGAMAGGNATTSMGGNQSEVRMHVQEARTALQNNDIQGAMMHLDLALNLVGGGAHGNMTSQGNMTSATGSSNSTG